tara:strand:- start:6404 stop:6571 length:168 start_codon:yes stop_codon:yes gene_type:complete
MLETAVFLVVAVVVANTVSPAMEAAQAVAVPVVTVRGKTTQTVMPLWAMEAVAWW